MARLGSGRWSSRPQPRSAPSTARLTAVAGSKILTSAVLSMMMPTLLGHRVSRECDLGRRGAVASHSAIAVNTLRNAPSLMMVSLIGIIDSR